MHRSREKGQLESKRVANTQKKLPHRICVPFAVFFSFTEMQTLKDWDEFSVLQKIIHSSAKLKV